MYAVRRRALGPLALLLAAAGCGVPLDEEPRPLDTPRSLDASGNPVPDAVGAVVLRLYLVRDGRLVRVPRRVPAPLTPAQQVDTLLAGPTADESADGLSSALTTMNVLDVRLQDRRATITVVDRPDQPVRADETLAFGQLVCTLTTQPDVGTVSFESDGQPLYVPRADGSISVNPLTIADYSGLLD